MIVLQPISLSIDAEERLHISEILNESTNALLVHPRNKKGTFKALIVVASLNF